VVHYVQNPDGSYSIIKEEDMEGNPSIPVKIDDLKHEYEGYEFEGGYGDDKKSYVPPEMFVEEVIISEDGTTIINIYYKLLFEPTTTTTPVSTPTPVKYTVIHYIKKPDGTYEKKEVEVKYGEPNDEIPIDDLKKDYEGYEFEGGSEDTKENPIPGEFVKVITVLPDGSRVVNLFYKEPEVKYTVIHYIKKPDGTYEKKEVEVKYGEPNGEIPIDDLKKDYEGYEFEGGSEDTKENPIPGEFVKVITILPDGSRVVNMFYNENPNAANITEPVVSSDEEITEIPTEDNNESSDEEEDEEQSQSDNVSSDGRCGKGIGRCKTGECCSKYGWCGKTEKHCKIELGCQSEFGKCKKSKGHKDSKENEVTEIQKVPEEDDNESSEEEEEEEEQGVSSDGKCGKRIGRCKTGECCSKYGWCGKTEKYCNVELGCQSEFGECTNSNKDYKNYVRKDGKCGKGIGHCKSGECCSKYGWCGKSDKYCNVKEGCQSEFGECHHKSRHSRKTTTVTKVKTATNRILDKCGKGYGSCKLGYCCSKYGWCGKSSSYCSKSKGCNSSFGKCW